MLSELSELLKGVTFDMSLMKEIRRVEDIYTKKGNERADYLEKLSKKKFTEEERNWFVLGYAECGQEMHSKIKEQV